MFTGKRGREREKERERGREREGESVGYDKDLKKRKKSTMSYINISALFLRGDSIWYSSSNYYRLHVVPKNDDVSLLILDGNEHMTKW